MLGYEILMAGEVTSTIGKKKSGVLWYSHVPVGLELECSLIPQLYGNRGSLQR